MSPSITLHFHPTPDKSNKVATFPDETAQQAYIKFERQTTQPALQAYWTALPKEREHAAAHLAKAREQAYLFWSRKAPELIA